MENNKAMKILLATDGSDFSQVAVKKCVDLFGNLPDAKIRIITVVGMKMPAAEPWVSTPDYFHEVNLAAHEHAKEVVLKAEAAMRNHCPALTAELSTEVITGSAKRAIVEYAESWGADLIVVGSNGYGFWPRALLGSISDSVVHHAPCSVLVVRTSESPEDENGSDQDGNGRK